METRTAKAPPPGLDLRVLLVDDNDLTRSLLGLILRSAGCQVVGEAADAAQALQLAAQHQPDLIFLDIFMPVTSGLEAIGPLRAAVPGARILMVSGADDADNVNDAIRAGAAGFIVKPFNSGSILNTVRKVRGEFQVTGPASMRAPA